MQELEKKLNYVFRNPKLLSEALSHSSYANEHRSAGLKSNERLEFLGDSVLGFVTAEFLFVQHPDLPGQGRLGNKKFPGRPGKTPRLCDAYEFPDLFVDDHSLTITFYL